MRVACAAAVVLWIAAYANSFGNAFHFDDDHVIERNLHLRDLSNVPRFFTDARTFSVFPQNATYRPLVSLTLAVDYAVSNGRSMVPYHVTQLLLFAAVGVLFGLLVRELLRKSGPPEPWQDWAALFAATLFCLHTANTQPGNYISARSELLCALGVLGAFLVYLRAPKLRRFGVYLLPMFLGALGKTPAVVFAPLLLVYKLVYEQEVTLGSLRTGDGWRRVARAVAGALPALIVAALVFRFVEGMNPAGQTYGGGDRLQYLWTQAFIWLRYVGLFFIPSGLSADTDLALLPTWKDPRVIAGAALFVGSNLAALWAAQRPQLRPVTIGVLWFWLGVLPTSSIFPLAEVTNDHRMFLGYLGLTLAVTTLGFVAVRAVASSRPPVLRVASALAVALLIAHAVGTHLRNRVWLDEETLWADVVEKSPKNGRGWMNYGLTQMRKGELARAKQLFLHAATLTPNYSVLEINLGVVKAALKEGDAEGHFRRAIQLAPNYASAHFYYARFLAEHRRAPEAIDALNRALAIDGGDPNPRHLLMDLLAARGELQALRAMAEQTLQLGRDPEAEAHLKLLPPFRAQGDDAEAWYQAGLALTSSQQHARAAQAYRAAIARDARHADAWNNLGWSLYALGFRAEATQAYAQALQLEPDHERARNNLALIGSP